ncbi:alpha-N-acetylneuraminate alpha-2,8-sialyltransferase ST8SIA3-like [Branchiostoma lanceolatum]|uniref:alpha-N-acetylneuraminate alpha-2,8-sialyltransferase ST8SIA3-like n=1 Tax=Branchiostoma lanceolatum TaxID=7740 RepID=UPI00345319E5
MLVRRSRKNVVGAVLFLSLPMAYLVLYGAGKLFQLQREWTKVPAPSPPKIRQITQLSRTSVTSRIRDISQHTPFRHEGWNQTHRHTTAKPLWTFNDARIAKIRLDIEDVCHLQKNIAMTKWNTWVGMAFPYDQEPRKIFRLTRTLFNLFPEKPPFEGKLFNTCSVVGNGGILLNSGCGAEIDSSDFVFRCNLPPIRGFEKDVGRKVNLTTMNPSILRIYYGRLATEKNRDDFVQKMVELKYSYLLIPIFVTVRGAKDVQILSEFLMSRQDILVKPLFPSKIWAKTVNIYWKLKSRSKLVEARLTTGLQLLTTALSMCKHVNMYGYYPSEISPRGTPIPYHYYEPNSTYNYTYGMGGIHNMTKEYEVVFKDMDIKRIARLRHQCNAP